MDERRVGNGWLLPVGNLRELPQRLNDVDFIIINSATLQHPNEYYMELTPQSIIPLLNIEDKQSERLPSSFDFIMTGIGNPKRFEETCERLNIQYANSLFYDDHFAYSPTDVPSGIILMTQKDAVKCRAFALPSWYYLPVKASFSGDFLVQLSDKLPHIYFCGLKGMMPGIQDMLKGVAAKKNIDYDEWLKGLKKNKQWHVEVY